MLTRIASAVAAATMAVVLVTAPAAAQERFDRPVRIELLNRHLDMALRAPDVVDKLRNVGMEPATSTPDEFGKRLAADHAKWGPVVKATGFTAE